jgi:LemA protein
VIAAHNAASAANADAASHPGNTAAMKQLTIAEGLLKDSLGRLFALSEAYPYLKANTTVLRLMVESTSTDNTISVIDGSSRMKHSRPLPRSPWTISYASSMASDV